MHFTYAYSCDSSTAVDLVQQDQECQTDSDNVGLARFQSKASVTKLFTMADFRIVLLKYRLL